MLVLARKVHQSIVIGDNIRIVVLAINGDRIRLGIEAPDAVPIIREEILENPRQSKDDKNLTSEFPLKDIE